MSRDPRSKDYKPADGDSLPPPPSDTHVPAPKGSRGKKGGSKGGKALRFGDGKRGGKKGFVDPIEVQAKPSGRMVVVYVPIQENECREEMQKEEETKGEEAEEKGKVEEEEGLPRPVFELILKKGEEAPSFEVTPSKSDKMVKPYIQYTRPVNANGFPVVRYAHLMMRWRHNHHDPALQTHDALYEKLCILLKKSMDYGGTDRNLPPLKATFGKTVFQNGTYSRYLVRDACVWGDEFVKALNNLDVEGVFEPRIPLLSVTEDRFTSLGYERQAAELPTQHQLKGCRVEGKELELTFEPDPDNPETPKLTLIESRRSASNNHLELHCLPAASTAKIHMRNSVPIASRPEVSEWCNDGRISVESDMLVMPLNKALAASCYRRKQRSGRPLLGEYVKGDMRVVVSEVVEWKYRSASPKPFLYIEATHTGLDEYLMQAAAGEPCDLRTLARLVSNFICGVMELVEGAPSTTPVTPEHEELLYHSKMQAYLEELDKINQASSYFKAMERNKRKEIEVQQQEDGEEPDAENARRQEARELELELND